MKEYSNEEKRKIMGGSLSKIERIGSNSLRIGDKFFGAIEHAKLTIEPVLPASEEMAARALPSSGSVSFQCEMQVTDEGKRIFDEMFMRLRAVDYAAEAVRETMLDEFTMMCSMYPSLSRDLIAAILRDAFTRATTADGEWIMEARKLCYIANARDQGAL